MTEGGREGWEEGGREETRYNEGSGKMGGASDEEQIDGEEMDAQIVKYMFRR